MTIKKFECWADDEEAPESGTPYDALRASYAAEYFAADVMDDAGCERMYVAVREPGGTSVQVYTVERELRYTARHNAQRTAELASQAKEV